MMMELRCQRALTSYILIGIIILFNNAAAVSSSPADMSSISIEKSLNFNNTREYLYWVQNKITMLQSFLYKVSVKYPDDHFQQVEILVSSPSSNISTTPEDVLKLSKFCEDRRNGYYSQPGNCNQYRSCSDNYEVSKSECATCSSDSVPDGYACCNGRLCWQPTSPTTGFCTWCKSSCECYPPFR